MMKNGFGSGFLTGLLCAALAAGLGVTALAASRSITVDDGVHITINGAVFTPRDSAGAELASFSYNGNAYLPAKALCEALGMTASYDAASRTVIITLPSVGSTPSPSAPANGYISADRAREIALNHAGIQAAEASFIKTELEWEDGRAEYEVEFYSGNTEYDYEIDAATGAILSFDRDIEDFQLPRQGQTPSSGYITADRAKEVALRHAPSGATVTKCKLDKDDGRVIYELELRNGGVEYECDIDAMTGDVISWEVDD